MNERGGGDCAHHKTPSAILQNNKKLKKVAAINCEKNIISPIYGKNAGNLSHRIYKKCNDNDTIRYDTIRNIMIKLSIL
jgi:hypothetical protein